MTRKLTYTLIADGSSDATLLKVIKWLLDDLYPQMITQEYFADFRGFRIAPKGLKEKIIKAKEYFPFDILFVHRDAESVEPTMISKRVKEIEDSIEVDCVEKTICIIPVKMMESWLLIDAKAIKKAAGNRNYKEKINLPAIKNIEKIQQPKQQLHDLLKEVSGLKGRNLDRFNVNKAVHLVAENIEDFSQLRNLNAFQSFECQLKKVVDSFLEIKYS